MLQIRTRMSGPLPAEFGWLHLLTCWRLGGIFPCLLFSPGVYALGRLLLAVSMPFSVTDAIEDTNNQHVVFELEVAGTYFSGMGYGLTRTVMVGHQGTCSGHLHPSTKLIYPGDRFWSPCGVMLFRFSFTNGTACCYQPSSSCRHHHGPHSDKTHIC